MAWLVILNGNNLITTQELKELLVATQAELAEQLTTIATGLSAVNDTLNEVATEVPAKLAELEAAIGQAGGTTPEVDAALAAVKSAAEPLQPLATQLADIVPNTVEPGEPGAE
jgi:methyl-accepting chemotaxis protein